ncbi:MAG: S9 family peptidase [Labilithrix sp.]|nr:S9 family peptidase [Labilithrix sp.]MCW5817773.1 S9 family peptidase [Labilithrix sp.]
MIRRVAALGLVASFLACGSDPPPPPVAPQPPPPAPVVTAPPPAKPAPKADPSVLARKVIFGNPDHAGPRVSYDGKQLAWLAPKDGVLNVYVAPINDPSKAKAVTDEKGRPVNGFFWTSDGKRVLYAIDKNGDENVHVYSVEIANGKVTDLTPFEKTQGRVQETSDKAPTTVLVAMNDRDAKYHDIYKVDLVSGKRTLVQKNEAGYAGFLTDEDFKVRYAMKSRPDGGSDVLVADGKGGFKDWQTIKFEETMTTGPMGFDKAGTTLYMRDSRDRDTSALFAYDTKTQKSKLLAEDARADLGGLIVSPVDGRVQAASFDYERRNWKVLDKSIEPDLEALKKVVDGDVEIVSRSRDDKTWTVAYVVSDGPVRYYVYDRTKKEAKFLFTNRPALEGKKLAKMHPVVIPSRDGKNLVSYLSLPVAADPDGKGKPSAPVPTVLLVHGGPWGRDGWGLNGMHQWLTSRGYGVLAVNFRGSTGFGKAFVNAGDKEWAGKMHDDLLDAVEWLKKNNVADPSKIAIMGGSYGGYATLVGLTFTPDVFACGVDIVGPSNLNTLLATIPPYWAPMFENFSKRIGDPRTDEGKKLLTERSPLTRAGAIQRPLLIGQGANDPRVKQAESDQIVGAMKAKSLPVSYVLFPDEGHGFARPPNRIAFNAVAEIFLAQHLGGVYEPIGSDFEGSSISVPEGAADIATLADALPKK